MGLIWFLLNDAGVGGQCKTRLGSTVRFDRKAIYTNRNDLLIMPEKDMCMKTRIAFLLLLSMTAQVCLMATDTPKPTPEGKRIRPPAWRPRTRPRWTLFEREDFNEEEFKKDLFLIKKIDDTEVKIVLFSVFKDIYIKRVGRTERKELMDVEKHLHQELN